MRLAFDHLAIAAARLETGVDRMRDALGVTVPAGGRHPLMATHNRLMALGENSFFEIIAPEPDASAARPRWFGLDDAPSVPALATWMLRSDDLDATLDALPDRLREALGPAITLTRGDLTWRLTVPEDGALPFEGALPTLIEWPMRPLPATRMADLGCTLRRLTVRHPEVPYLADALAPLFSDSRVVFERGDRLGLEAVIGTPSGDRRLGQAHG